MTQIKPKDDAPFPVIPMRDRVVFPGLTVNLVIGRPRSVQAVRKAMEGNRKIFVVTQRNMDVERPERKDLFDFGVIAEIQSVAQLREGNLKVRIVAKDRAQLLDFSVKDGAIFGDAQIVEEESLLKEKGSELEARRRLLTAKFEAYVRKSGQIPYDSANRIIEIPSLPRLADSISDAIFVSVEEKQDLVEMPNVKRRMDRLIEILDSEIEILSIKEKIQSRVDKQILKGQREYVLNEQMRAIQKELKKKDEHGQEVDGFRQKLKSLGMPQESEEAVQKEMDRLEKMAPFSPEATVIRSYLETVLGLPWNVESDEKIDLSKTKKILEKGHFGLEKPKERILEYLAVLKLTKTIKGPILCLVGPPGTGKTSLAKDMAQAMGRKFHRISLGGVRDEAEIRGHRRTYIGSMPGRIIQALRKTGTKNPVILLDEIDKMGSDWRGDPAAALLEVLDPEQNKGFLDHFIDLEFDLSKVIFIATANTLYNVPRTLLDRLEVIRFSAYTTEEKVAIANEYIVPKELKEHGLPENALEFNDEALRKLVHTYTQEAGVRGLQRKIGKICRKVAVEIVNSGSKGKKGKTVKINLKDLASYLGPAEFVREKISPNAVGISTGLAWTEHGGETLTIEVTFMPGSGKIIMTGKLGEVMRESAQAAFSLIKSKSSKLKIPEKKFNKKDVHIHVPEGAVPKDGPSAGTALATAIYSALSGKPVRKDVAMTGEVTLTGRVLAIGGLKEKTLAAVREGVQVVLFPKANEKDLPEIPESVRKKIKLTPVEKVEDVFKIAFGPPLPRQGSWHRKSTSIHQ